MYVSKDEISTSEGPERAWPEISSSFPVCLTVTFDAADVVKASIDSENAAQ